MQWYQTRIIQTRGEVLLRVYSLHFSSVQYLLLSLHLLPCDHFGLLDVDVIPLHLIQQGGFHEKLPQRRQKKKRPKCTSYCESLASLSTATGPCSTLYLSASFLECRNCLLISWLRMDTGLSSCTTGSDHNEIRTRSQVTASVNTWRCKVNVSSTWMLKWSKMAVNSSFLFETSCPKEEKNGMNNVSTAKKQRAVRNKKKNKTPFYWTKIHPGYNLNYNLHI